MTGEMEWTLTGKWRITEADLWGRDYLAPVEPAHITFEGNGHGEFTFGCVNGGLDCEYSRQITFFTWQGFNEMDEVSGDGSAKLDDDGSLEIEVRFHLGDEVILKAQKWRLFSSLLERPSRNPTAPPIGQCPSFASRARGWDRLTRDFSRSSRTWV